MSLTVYLGIDVGSVTTKLALVDEKGKYVDSVMLRTAGKPVMAVQNGLKQLYDKKLTEYDVKGVGTTGSGRNLAGALVGADVIKNEITAHAVAASINVPGVQTILEIGGQENYYSSRRYRNRLCDEHRLRGGNRKFPRPPGAKIECSYRKIWRNSA